MTKDDRHDGGDPSEPEVYAISREKGKWKLSRRQFLGAAVGAAAAAGAVRALGEEGKKAELSCENVFAHRDHINALGLSPEGKTLFSGSADSTIKVWSLPEGTLVKTFEGHRSIVGAVAVSPDGKTLFSGSFDHTIRRWSLPDGKPLGCFMDLAATPSDAKGIQYKSKDVSGREVTYTLPCGSPIPPGATCICNCVPGSWSAPAPATGSSPNTNSAPSTYTYTVHYWYPD